MFYGRAQSNIPFYNNPLLYSTYSLVILLDFYSVFLMGSARSRSSDNSKRNLQHYRTSPQSIGIIIQFLLRILIQKRKQLMEQKSYLIQIGLRNSDFNLSKLHFYSFAFIFRTVCFFYFIIYCIEFRAKLLQNHNCVMRKTIKFVWSCSYLKL
ncbi:unnamed protein product [Paramecium octaurelia]|uniref:Transmembrane protein n=1 Tax=Paramecium octaurelia TaxID=43137 RepID=A0A8S1XGT0_PAROT|nr:unnamed protein product [Paramecium octaurelia]